MHARRLSLAALLLGLLVLVASPTLASTEEDLDAASQSLERFEKALKKKSSVNEELISLMHEVAEHYKGLKPPEAPTVEEVPEGATEEEAKAIQDRNKKAAAAHKSDVDKFERLAAKFRKKAVKAILKAFKLVKPHRNSETNQREDVNTEAVKVLAELGDPEVSDDIIKAMESVLFKARGYEVTELLFETAFASLGKLNDEDALDWMISNFTHSKSSPRREVNKLVAAHKAMVLFKDPPGKLRYQAVKEMVKTYAGVESQAETPSSDPAIQAKKQFWDRIKGDAIKAVQYFASGPDGVPTNEDGEALARMDDFQAWFRDHKNPKRAPWKDAKKK